MCWTSRENDIIQKCFSSNFFLGGWWCLFFLFPTTCGMCTVLPIDQTQFVLVNVWCNQSSSSSCSKPCRTPISAACPNSRPERRHCVNYTNGDNLGQIKRANKILKVRDTETGWRRVFSVINNNNNNNNDNNHNNNNNEILIKREPPVYTRLVHKKRKRKKKKKRG